MNSIDPSLCDDEGTICGTSKCSFKKTYDPGKTSANSVNSGSGASVSLVEFQIDGGLIEDANIVGPRLREIRESLGLKQEQLAARCNLFGWDVSRGTYAKIECQSRQIKDWEAVLLAKALGVELAELFEGLRQIPCSP